MIDHDLAAELVLLAEAIARLKPISSRNPHAFHEERSELASRARSLAQRARFGQPTVAADVPAPVGRQVVSRSHRVINGARLLVEIRRSASMSIEPLGVR